MRRILAFLLIVSARAVCPVAAATPAPPPAPDKPFELMAPEDLPDFGLKGLRPADLAYLGVRNGSRSLRLLPADVVLLEFLNVHCPACRQQAPVLNAVYRDVQARKDLAGRVKFLGVAAGNTGEEVDRFRKEQQVAFPVLADPAFEIYDQVGSPEGLPFLMIATLKPPGGGEPAVKGHLGIKQSGVKLLGEIEAALTARGQDMLTRMARWRKGEWRNLKLNASESYVRRQLVDAARAAGMERPEPEAVELGKDEVVYRITGADGRRLWGKVAGRARICNVCHHIFFIILFDDRGTVAGFHPLAVTKGNNEKWGHEDAAYMNRRLKGMSVLKAPAFDPKVDAVTSATMSSDLIFDTVRRLGDTWRLMNQKGLLQSGSTKPLPSLSGAVSSGSR